MPESAISVTDLTLHVKAMVEGLFPSLWVSGEISDLVRARSGHIYFTLKDDTAQIRGVMWRSAAERLQFDLEDGQAVLCFGNLEVYTPRGTYQLVVRKVQPQGIGALQLAFQKLQAKLEAEGLFDPDRKRPLPTFPRRIGIVTSPTGAAVRDFLEAAANRWRGVEVVVIPAQVQGKGAARTIVAGIKAAQRIQPKLDVLVVSRGGGSLEDLWCFNEEPVVRALAQSEIPTVSAVGHEVDVCLCDLAADVRALTPTDAATRVLPDSKTFDLRIVSLTDRLNRSARNYLNYRKLQLELLTQRSPISKPHELIQLRTRRLDELDACAQRALSSQVQASQAKLAKAAASLQALSPLSVLTRGYSVTINDQNQTIDDVKQLTTGDTITTKFRSGEIESKVTKIRNT